MKQFYTNMKEIEVEESEMLDGIDMYEALTEIWPFADYKKSQPASDIPLYGKYISWIREKEDEAEDLVCLTTLDDVDIYFFMPDDLSVKCWLDDNDQMARRRWEDER